MRDAASLLEQLARPAANMSSEGPSMAGPRESATELGAPVGSARKVSWFLVRLAIAGGLLAYLVRSGGIDWRALTRPFTAWPIALAAVALVSDRCLAQRAEVVVAVPAARPASSVGQILSSDDGQFLFRPISARGHGRRYRETLLRCKRLQRSALGNRHRVAFRSHDRHAFAAGHAPAIRPGVCRSD